MPQVIAGRYELVEALGRGGMGAVWRARDRTLAREVAVKEVVLPTGLSPEQVERVYARTFREARAAARLDHPGIVTVHDVVEEDGRPWIVMRLVRAPALDKVIQREGPLPPARVAAIGLDLLAALRAAHAAGIVHRDVKPGNVLLPPQGAVLTDFGIATATGDETLTATGAIVGSPAYLAPEQARHQKATPASDLWSLGATLYAAVEGRSPFQRGDVWGVMAALLSDDPDPMRNAGPLAQPERPPEDRADEHERRPAPATSRNVAAPRDRRGRCRSCCGSGSAAVQGWALTGSAGGDGRGVRGFWASVVD
ncbi:serine/threonine-protein kinase [Actinomadura kijaniata]|uniref:serine/threonine-protein kinase n=1 Tax=Actinomadura kijaniata TaxID=46161 RepID=UPI003F1B5823